MGADKVNVDLKQIAWEEVSWVSVAQEQVAGLQINPTRCTTLLSTFISLIYMFRANMCPSSEEITVSIRHWYLSLCMGGFWSAGWSETSTSRPEATHTE
jgi:hypothetical protein